jgi:FkbM family methyltransferase
MPALRITMQKEISLKKEPFFQLSDPITESKRKFAAIDSICEISTVVDVGSNEGQFALHSSLAFPNARHYCFEPLSGPFDVLSSKFARNKNFSLFNYALGYLEGKSYIFANEYSPSSSILEMNELHKTNFEFTRQSSREEIEVKRLDSLLNLITPDLATLIKIDVQGFETDVLKGGHDFIKKCGVLIIEMSFKKLYKDQPLFHEVYSILYDLGFRYHGNIEQLLSPINNQILQADCLFFNQCIDV